MRLHLVRHGQTGSNLVRALDTAEPGAPLTDEGRRQAAAVGAAFAGERVDAVWASTLVRTQQTAEPLAGPRGLPVVVRAGLREVVAGDLEMRTDDEAVHQYLGTMMRWADGDLDVVMPGGESGRQTLARFDAVVDELRGTGAQVAAVVSHGAVIRMWAITRAANLTVRDAVVQTLDNTGVVTLEEDGAGGWYATRWQEELVPHGTEDGPAGDPLPL